MSGTDKREAADLIVVGASAGGLAMALLAADHGGRVIVAERTKALGGSAVLEPEHVAACGTRYQRSAGIDDSVEAMMADLTAAARRDLEQPLAEALVRESAALVEWLADRCGLDVTLIERSAGRGHGVARLHGVGDHGGAGLVATLAQLVGLHPRIRTRLGVEAESLTRDAEGRVVGVELARQRRSDPPGLDGTVVLACGGYAGSDAIVQEQCPGAAMLPALPCATATGAGVALARPAGARLTRLDAMAVTPLLAVPTNLAVDGILLSLGGILVNQSGLRFVSETSEPVEVALAVRAQPGKLAYLVFDDRTARDASAQNPYLGRVVIPKTARRAASLADLARQLTLDAAGLARSVDTLNASVETGRDPFGRELRHRLEPPFHALRVTGSRTRSLGGVAVDPVGRVLHESGAPIPGLYALGGVVGSLGRSAAGELAGLAPLVSLGIARLAARSLQDAPAAA